jgi:hypothetical protein
MAEPSNADTLAEAEPFHAWTEHVDSAHDLVARNDR